MSYAVSSGRCNDVGIAGAAHAARSAWLVGATTRQTREPPHSCECIPRVTWGSGGQSWINVRREKVGGHCDD